jgi:hypothetical protein
LPIDAFHFLQFEILIPNSFLSSLTPPWPIHDPITLQRLLEYEYEYPIISITIFTIATNSFPIPTKQQQQQQQQQKQEPASP